MFEKLSLFEILVESIRILIRLQLTFDETKKKSRRNAVKR